MPNAQAVAEYILALFGHQIDLIAQVNKRGVDRRRREHQYFGLGAFLNHFFQQPRVAAMANIAVVIEARF